MPGVSKLNPVTSRSGGGGTNRGNQTNTGNPSTNSTSAPVAKDPAPITVEKLSYSSSNSDPGKIESSGNLRFPVLLEDPGTGNIPPYVEFSVFKQTPGYGKTNTQDPFYSEAISGLNILAGSETVKVGAIVAAGLSGFGTGATAAASAGIPQAVVPAGMVTAGATGLAAAGAVATAEYVFNNTQYGTLLKNSLNNMSFNRNNTERTRSIQMLMPEGINVSYDHDYDTISATNALGAVGGVLQGMNAYTNGGGDKHKIDPYVLEAASKVADRLGEDAGKLTFYGMSGLVVNPKMEVIYTSPKLRTFVFDFRLVPRSRNDSAAIAQIIRAFKYHAAPSIPDNITSGRYFIPPDQFTITFYDGNRNDYGSEKQQHMFKTKYCVLTNISVDYTAAGGFSSFDDGTPSETRMQLQFQETTILNKADISGGYF